MDSLKQAVILVQITLLTCVIFVLNSVIWTTQTLVAAYRAATTPEN